MSFSQVKYAVDESMLKTDDDKSDDFEHEIPLKNGSPSESSEVKKSVLTRSIT